MKEKSAVLQSPGKIAIREFEIPSVGSDDMLIKVEMTSVCGTDPKLYEDKFVTHTFPIILGHELVGRVAAIGNGAKKVYRVKEGDRVTVEPQILCRRCRYCLTGYYQLCETVRTYGVDISCDTSPHLWGGYGEYMFVADGSKVHMINGNVTAEAACLSSVLGNGVRWIRTIGQVKFGEVVVIIGPGAQGLASVIAAKEAGAGLIIIIGLSSDRKRFELAKKFGADGIINIEKEDPFERLRDITEKSMADIVVECSGSPESFKLGVDLLKPLGRFVLAGMTGPVLSQVDTSKIVCGELKILGGNGQSWDMELAVSIINSKKYYVENMVTHVFGIEEAEKAILFQKTNKEECIKAAIKP